MGGFLETSTKEDEETAAVCCLSFSPALTSSDLTTSVAWMFFYITLQLTPQLVLDLVAMAMHGDLALSFVLSVVDAHRKLVISRDH